MLKPFFKLIFPIALHCISGSAAAQCCSGGGGGAGFTAGNFAQGVLLKNQFEFNLNFQHTYTNRFQEGRNRMASDEYHALAPNNYLDALDSKLLYSRLQYGLNERLTLSLEAGYYPGMTEYRENYLVDTIRSSGFSDFVIFPRYNVFLRSTPKHQCELVVGVGLKIPVGHYNDSVLVFSDPATGTEYYDRKSPVVQTTTGSHDFYFSASLARKHYPSRVNLNLLGFYAMKGWTPQGEKFGDYLGISLIGSREIFKYLALMTQVKAEHTWPKQRAGNAVDATSSTDLAENSGSDKLFITPGLIFNLTPGCSHTSVSLYTLTEIPVYQHLGGIQLNSYVNYTAGITIRILPKRPETALHIVTEQIYVYGNCEMCKATIEKALSKKAGIKSGNWNAATKTLSVAYDPARINMPEIHETIAAAGYDTDLVKAPDEVYSNLHPCCQYERAAHIK